MRPASLAALKPKSADASYCLDDSHNLSAESHAPRGAPPRGAPPRAVSDSPRQAQCQGTYPRPSKDEDQFRVTIQINGDVLHTKK